MDMTLQKIRKPGWILFFVLWAISAGPAFPSEEVVHEPEKVEIFQYVGARRCGVCHRGRENDYIYERWQVSKHAMAFDNLSEEGQILPKCLSCHTTGFWEQDKWYKGVTAEDLHGVQCEACHGPGSMYRKPFAMNKKLTLKDPEAQRQVKIKAGLKFSTEESCKKCHNENCPNYKPLVIDNSLSEMIHPSPRYLEQHILDRFQRIGK